MTAEEIRKIKYSKDDTEIVAVSILVEIAAQLAEMNYSLKKIANPMLSATDLAMQNARALGLDKG